MIDLKITLNGEINEIVAVISELKECKMDLDGIVDYFKDSLMGCLLQVAEQARNDNFQEDSL